MKIALLFVLLTVMSNVFALEMECGTYKEYQHDMDIVRLKDLKEIGFYIEEFRKLTGKYPLEGFSEKPIYVFIITAEQKEYLPGKEVQVPDGVISLEIKKFIKVLENGLGRKVSFPYEPQTVPVNMPPFYIYSFAHGYYNLAVHLHNEYSFSRKIAQCYNKLEVSSAGKPEYKIWGYEELMSNQSYLEAISEKLHKPGYVESMRSKL